MAKRKAAAPLEEVQVVQTPSGAVVNTTAEEEAKPVKGEVVVRFRDHAGNPTERTFSKAVHGEDFAKLAAEFKKTNATRIIE